jgi:hypothetical protein
MRKLHLKHCSFHNAKPVKPLYELQSVSIDQNFLTQLVFLMKFHEHLTNARRNGQSQNTTSSDPKNEKCDFFFGSEEVHTTFV